MDKPQTERLLRTLNRIRWALIGLVEVSLDDEDAAREAIKKARDKELDSDTD